MRLSLARRRWPRQVVGPYEVHVTANVGPAVFGVFRPAIVVPVWLLDQPRATREAALLHEQQHIAAHDPALLLAALLLLVLAAWNLPLWWQLRRLRLAIEVDCDARVLGTGVESGHYLNTLLCINQRARTRVLGAIAIVGRGSQLERRVRAMSRRSPRHATLWMAAWVLAAIPLLVVAAQLDPPPPAPAAMTGPHAHLGIGVADFDVNGLATHDHQWRERPRLGGRAFRGGCQGSAGRSAWNEGSTAASRFLHRPAAPTTLRRPARGRHGLGLTA
jgi:hypothetical protein